MPGLVSNALQTKPNQKKKLKLPYSPRRCPFLVKKAVFVLKLMPQPMTSRVPNLGPYDFPEVVLLKTCPSSPWYAYESGSQPGIRLKATFGPEKPIPIILLQGELADVTAKRRSYEPIFAFGNDGDFVVIDAALPRHGEIGAYRCGFVVRLLGTRELGHSSPILELQLVEAVAVVPSCRPGCYRLVYKHGCALDDLVGETPV